MEVAVAYSVVLYCLVDSLPAFFLARDVINEMTSLLEEHCRFHVILLLYISSSWFPIED